MTELTRPEEIETYSRDGEDETDQAFGEDVESAGSSEAPAGEAGRLGALEGVEEESQAEDQPETNENIRDQETGEEIGPRGDAGSEGRIEPCVFAKDAAAQKVNRNKESQYAYSERQPSGPIVYSKNFEARGHGPVQEGRLFQVTDAIDVESDPVVTEHHFAGGFGVDGVGVIQKRRPKKGSAIGGQPKQKKNREMDALAGIDKGVSGHAAAVRKEWSDGAENLFRVP
jgi:hypothetical protein